MPHLPQPVRARSIAFSRTVRRKTKAAQTEEIVPAPRVVAAGDTGPAEPLAAAASSET
jgi:hypothetical protein